MKAEKISRPARDSASTQPVIDLRNPSSFVWATGIEDTFITAEHPVTGRQLDEYELTQHYKHWRSDLDLMRELGVSAARYGVPWHRVNPQRNSWDWSFADQTIDYLLQIGIEPIVDLVHYGTPLWMENAFAHPDFPKFMAEYAARLAERFRGRVRYYTPLNEPRITAWYCGRIGWWPPYGRSWRGFVELMLAICRGIVQTTRALTEIDQHIVPVHVDATDLYFTDEAALQPEVEKRQEIVFLALDLVSGRVTGQHPLRQWLNHNGARDGDLSWFQENALEIPIVGINLYPMFSKKRLTSSSRGIRIQMPYAPAQIVADLARLYHLRYQCPIMITETATVGTVAKREQWLSQSIEVVRELRASGVPLVGYTWWPMFSLVAWAYRQTQRPVSNYLLNMGLWDLNPNTLERERTPLVDSYSELVTSDKEMMIRG